MANPVVQSSNTQTGASVSSIVITKPTGLAVGDLMVAALAMHDSADANRTFSTPSGWTLATNSTTGQSTLRVRTAIFSKVADSSDAAASNFTFSLSGSVGYVSGVLARITGQATPAINVSESDASNTASLTAYSATTALTPDTVTNSLILFNVAGTDSDADLDTVSGYATTPSATYTELADIGIGNGLQHGIAYADYDSNTQLTNRSATFGSDTNMQASSIVVIRGTIDGSGTTALLTVTPTEFSPAGRADTNGTADLVTASVEEYDATGYANTVTQWTNQSSASTTWTNETT